MNHNGRYILVAEGCGMESNITIFKTNAPMNFLQSFEKECHTFIFENGYENANDLPKLWERAEKKGYLFECVKEYFDIRDWHGLFDLDNEDLSDIEKEALKESYNLIPYKEERI